MAKEETYKPKDEKDIGPKLRKMIAKGELTPEQVREKMTAWLAKATMANVGNDSPKDENEMGLKLRKMIAKGEITPEQVREKMAWEKRVAMAKAKYAKSGDEKD